jgi:thiol-disulfide isomerase/thioredoxin
MKRRGKLAAVAVLVALCALAVAWDWWTHRQAPGDAVMAGALPTAVQAEALVPYVNPAARYTVVHFWATWCPPCMVEMPNVLQALKALPPEVAVTMVSLDNPSPSAFYAKEQIRLTERAEGLVSWVDDPEQVRAKAILGKVMLPTTLIVDGVTGRIVQQVDGPLSWAPLLAALAKLD